MKVFFKPKVYLIMRPQLDMAEVARFLAHDMDGQEWTRLEPTTPGEMGCEFIGRMCYNSFGERQGRKSTKDYIANLLDHGHGSVLEHANWSFLVTRCTRGYTHQMVRHRAGFSYSQESTHFVEYDPKSARASLPGFDTGLADQAAEQCRAIAAAVDAYAQALAHVKAHFKDCKDLAAHARKKAACGTARALLPNAVESKLGFTANARALRHFLELRGADDNVPEIRMVAAEVIEIMRREAPTVFADFVAYKASDGFVALTSRYRKV